MTSGIGNSILFAVLPPLARDIGLADLYVGLIYSVSAVLFTIFSQVWGQASDRFGRRPILVVGLTGYAGSMAVFAATAQAALAGLLAPMAAFAGFAAARAVFGAFGSAGGPAAIAYVADRTPPETRTEAIAGLTAAFGLGATIGPLLAAVLAAGVGYIAPLLAAAGAALGLAVAVAFLLPERTPPKDAPRSRFQPGLVVDPRLRAVLAAGGLTWIVQASCLQTVVFTLMDRTGVSGDAAAPAAGVVISVGAAAALFAQLVLIRFLHPTPRRAILWGCASMVVGSLILAGAPGTASLAVGFIGIGMGAGLVRPGVSAGASVMVGPAEQGAAAGLATATAGLGFFVAPAAGLGVRAVLGSAAPYLLCAALCVAAAWLVARGPAGLDLSRPRPQSES